MAIVDLNTGKITGCEEGSKTWWHEKGHIEFNNREWGARVSYWQYHFMMVSVFFLSLSIIIDNIFLKIFTFMNALGMILSYIYEEIWCWIWGLKQYYSKN